MILEEEEPEPRFSHEENFNGLVTSLEVLQWLYTNNTNRSPLIIPYVEFYIPEVNSSIQNFNPFLIIKFIILDYCKN